MFQKPSKDSGSYTIPTLLDCLQDFLSSGPQLPFTHRISLAQSSFAFDLEDCRLSLQTAEEQRHHNNHLSTHLSILILKHQTGSDQGMAVMKTGCQHIPGHWGQQESCVRVGFWQRRGGQTSVSHRTRPLWHVHCVQESMFHVSPSTKYSPPGAWQIDGLVRSGFCTIISSGKNRIGRQAKSTVNLIVNNCTQDEEFLLLLKIHI